jgi:hypothetical protein
MNNLLKDSAIILTLLTTILYSIGTAHFYGMCTELHINPTMLERTFHQILYDGVIVAINNTYVQICFVIILIIAAITLLSICPAMQRFIRKIKTKIRVRIRKRLGYRRSSNNINFDKILAIPTLILAGTSLTVVLIIFFQNVGRHSAEEMLKDVRIHKSGLSRIFVKNGELGHELINISCGTNYCITIDHDANKIWYVHKDNILYSTLPN